MSAWLLWVAAAWARAGGGHGFSGGGGRSSGGGGGGLRGGGSYGGGGGSGDGDGAALLIWLIFEHPFIGVPLVVGVLVVAMSQRQGAASSPRVVVHGRPPVRGSASTVPILARDPDFSVPLFLDLARLVFTRVHEDRANLDSAVTEAYVDAQARAQLGVLAGTSGGPVTVRDVIIGTAVIVSADVRGDAATLVVEFEANITERERKLLVSERWAFQRAASTRSPGPNAMRALACPQCGGTVERLRDGRCANCDTILVDGRIQWRVVRIDRARAREVPRVELALGGGIEQGTTLPTVRAPDLTAQLRALQARDPAFDGPAFDARVREVFQRIQTAWGAMRYDDARPYETDFLYAQHRYWIDRYRAEGLRNRVEDARVHGVQRARVTVDAWVETITVRVEASMLDWTEDATGRVVGGSRDERKMFTEYWTFVRTAGKSHRAAPTASNCPSCGAPLDNVSQAGICGYCDAHITGGDFDWVLSAIEQDEVYRG